MIEYISAFNITAAVETRPSQLHNFLYFTPPLPPPIPNILWASSPELCEILRYTYLFKYVSFFVLFVCSLAHRLALRISLSLYILYIVIVQIQVYNCEIRYHSTVCRCGVANI